MELAMPEHQQPASRLTRRTDGAPAVVEQRDLAQEVARPKGPDRRSATVDPHIAGDDHVELVAERLLVRELMPGRHLELSAQCPDRLELVVVQPHEQRDRAERRELLVHVTAGDGSGQRSSSSVPWRRLLPGSA